MKPTTLFSPLSMAGSTLPTTAQNAAQSALNAAIADSPPPELEAGQIDEEQVLELESSAPGIDSDRTVFEDPRTFTVKVYISFFVSPPDDMNFIPFSTHYTLHGHYGSILQTRKAGMAPHRPLRRPYQQLHRLRLPKVGWTTSKRSYLLTAWKSSGGKCLVYSHFVLHFDLNYLPSLYNNIVPPSNLPPKANYYLFKVRLWHCFSFLDLSSSGAGRNHSSLGRCGQQRWWQMEYTIAKRQKSRCHRSDVALHSEVSSTIPHSRTLIH